MGYFCHHSDREQTIAAIATPPGEGGVAIIRISGKESLEISNRIFSRDVTSFVSHQAYYGRILDGEGRTVDRVLFLAMKAPRSYTGEDVVEIHCHGGSLMTRRILSLAIEAGARTAEPGEFTLRAFLNGKIDLTQAEAVQSLISAKSERALDAAGEQLQGRLSSLILNFQMALTDLAAILEAWVDFPEEGLEFATMEEMQERLQQVIDRMESLLATYHDGRILHEGIALCLAGRPNVGKSSLMNALLDRDRAIVTAIAGTTRDLLEEELKLNGLKIKLIDTAGIRESDEAVEQEGIRRSRQAIGKADLILLILDAAIGLTEEDEALMESLPAEKTIVVWNKCDLPHSPLPSTSFSFSSEVSAKQLLGLDELKKLIDKVIWQKGPPEREQLLLTEARHQESLAKSLHACKRVLKGLETHSSPEFISLDMRDCLNELGAIIGTNITEDILSAIFSKFCVGK